MHHTLLSDATVAFASKGVAGKHSNRENGLKAVKGNFAFKSHLRCSVASVSKLLFLI